MQNPDGREAWPADPRGVPAAILAGGHSRRMGCDKASLRLGGETFLQRICRALSGYFQPLVVVCRPDQQADLMRMLDALGGLEQSQVIADQHPGRGPLEGLATALEFLAQAGFAKAVVSTCDAPLVQPRLLAWLASQLETGPQAVIPTDEQHLYGLTAAYRPDIWTTLRQRLEQGERRVIDLPRFVATRLVTLAQCRGSDPHLLSFQNANTPAEYQLVCRLAETSC